MKKFISFFLILLSFAVVYNASASETISLQFSYTPVDCPSVYFLPNGYYEAVYYTPNTSEFWLDQGSNNVTNCVVEVFDSIGQSIWCFPVLRVDILQDDIDAFYWQNTVETDHIVFEYYWNHSFERYVSKKWSFAGEPLSTSFDSIQQPEEAFRYIITQYPYTLEMWPLGDVHNTPAKLTYVVDDSSVDLPFSYGINTTCVSSDERYFMLYEADDVREGESKVVYLLSYVPATNTLAYYRTDLETCSGHMAISNNTLSFLKEINEQTYMLYTAMLDDVEQSTIHFTATCEIIIDRNEVIDNLIPVGNNLLCVVSKVIDRNTETEHQESELCIISTDGDLASVQKWDGEVSYLKGTTSPLQFVCADETGGYQIIKLIDEDVAYFFTYFDHAQ